MIVKDEEALLPQCLESVQGVVDEMIVVDTGSQDNTVELAQGLGAQVFDFPWQDDFASARNFSLSKATQDWILVLDADERLIEDCVSELRSVLNQPDYLASTLLRYEVGALQNPYSLVSRLFRRHPQIQFERPFHETVDDSITALTLAESQWRIGRLSEPAILHEGYRPEAIADRKKAERAVQSMARYLQTHPDDAYICSKLGALYVSQGNVTEGLTVLEQGLAKQPEDSSTIYELHYHLGLAYNATQQWELADVHYRQALQIPLPEILKVAAYINLGALCHAQQNWSQAQALFEAVLIIQPDLAIAHYNLGLLHKAQSNYAAAIEAYQKAIALDPHSAEPHQNLGVVYLKIGQIPQAIESFQQAIVLHENTNPAAAQHLRQSLIEMGFLTNS
jgi:tetratricopeptide (TPR) repeat protein